MQNKFEERRRRIAFGRYVKDMVFAANDGIITTFAVVAGTAGASLSPSVVMIVGFANLIADGFSMATGDYLGTESEYDFYEKERSVERPELRSSREHALSETREILARKGFSGEKLDNMLTSLTANEELWIDFLMHEEFGLLKPVDGAPLKSAVITFATFSISGFIPLIPYVFQMESTFLMSAVFGGIALFSAGALRRHFSGRHWISLGSEMLIMGGFAAVIAFLTGFLLKQTFGV